MKILLFLIPCLLLFECIATEKSKFTDSQSQLIAKESFEKLDTLLLNQAYLIQDLRRLISTQEDKITDLEGKLNEDGNRLSNQEQISGLPTLDRRQVSGTTPQVAFSAYLNESLFHLAADQIVRYDKLLINHGGHYNSFTGVFTCPVDGVYLFSFFIDQWGESTHLLASLIVDGVKMVQGVANPTITKQDAQGGNLAILRLRAGQHVWVANYHSDGHIWSSDRNRYDTFSGFLLFQ